MYRTCESFSWCYCTVLEETDNMRSITYMLYNTSDNNNNNNEGFYIALKLRKYWYQGALQ